MSSKKLSLITALVLSLGAASAHAEGFYGSVNVGASLSNSGVDMVGTNSGGSSAFELGNGAVFGVGAGYRLTDNWRVELDLRHRQAKTSGNITQATRPQNAFLGSATETFDLNTKVRSTTLMANVAYDFKLSGKLTPYLKAGVGMAHHKTTGLIDIAPNFDIFGIPDGSAYPNKSNTTFAWNVGAGVSYPLTEKVSVNLDYQYIDMGKTGTGVDPLGDSVKINSVNAHEVSLGLRYAF